MQSLALSGMLLVFVEAILAMIASVLAFRMCFTAQPSRTGIVLATLPPLLMMVLFYSLAIHMHHTLGAWPTSIGDRGFPPSLVVHGDIVAWCFGVVFLLSFWVWPIAFLLCLFIRRWRAAISYLGAYAFSFLISFGSMQLAPSPFLNWWWD